MKALITSFTLLILLFPTAFAQVKGNASYERQSNTITLPNVIQQSYAGNSRSDRFDPHSTHAFFPNDSAFVIQVDAMMNTEADSYVAFLAMTQVGRSLDSVYKQMDSRIMRLLNALEAQAKLPTDDVYVDFISLVPTFEFEVEKKLFSKDATEIPSGYELSKAIHIPYERPEQLDLIMLAAAKGEVYDLVKVDYVVSDIQAVYDTLRTAAIDLINEKKADYAKMGFTFDQPKFTILADDIVSTYPVERYKSYSAFSSTPLGYDKFKKVEKVKKNQSYYYDKINYNDFDIVIHPRVVEPAVQFMYTLQVMFTLGAENPNPE